MRSGDAVVTTSVTRIGATTLFLLREMGRMLIFLLSSFAWLFRPPFRPFQILKQLHFIGFKSTFVVVLTAAFTGMVLGLQGYYMTSTRPSREMSCTVRLLATCSTRRTRPSSVTA